MFIGPPSAAITLMGDKTAARRAMQAARMPVVPGIDHLLQDDEDAHQVVATIGYPVMIKAALGGAAKACAWCITSSSSGSTARRRSEAHSSFGDPAIYRKICPQPSPH